MLHISIIVPIYNAAKSIRHAILSVIKQTYHNWDLVLIDDGSIDDSLSICKYWEEKDSRIHVLHQENAGAFSARRAGYDYCEQFGKKHFIAFLDADDCFSSHRSLEIYVNTIISEHADIVCSTYDRILSTAFPLQIPTHKNSIMQEKRSFHQNQILDELYVSFFGLSLITTSLCDKIFKYDILSDAMHSSQHAKSFAEDLFINMLTFPHAKTITLIPDTTYLYSRGGGTSGFMPSFMDDAIIMYHAKLDCLQKYSIPQNGELLVKIELRNLLYTWLMSYICKQTVSDVQAITEINRCANLPEIKEVMLTAGVYNHQHIEFSKSFNLGDFDKVLSILKKEHSENTILRKIKSYISQLLKK